MKRILIKLIKLYQSIPGNFHNNCRFIPTCSNYGLECYGKFNFIKASFLTGYRILRCNPLSKNIYDPVPLTKEQKKIKKAYLIKASIIDKDLINIFNNTCSYFRTNFYIICFILFYFLIIHP